MSQIVVVQGGQYGSEAKGTIAAWLCQSRDIHYAVRTGAINAGHTVYYGSPIARPYKMQQLPTGWVNPTTRLVIGAGAYIHPFILANEVKMIAEATNRTLEQVRNTISIDYRAALHTDIHEETSRAANRHHLIGATGKGCSQAIVDKINRRGQPGAAVLFRDTTWSSQYRLVDTSDLLNRAYDDGDSILLEGTQGSLLDLHLGPWPYTTSRMTTAANWVAEAGLSPSLNYQVILILRTFPIRVAGNSGPLPREINWVDFGNQVLDHWEEFGRPADAPSFTRPDLAAFEIALGKASRNFTIPPNLSIVRQETWLDHDRVRYREALSEINATALLLLHGMDPEAYDRLAGFFELTTVTRKLRRIAEWDPSLVNDVVRRERPAYLVITFLNYMFSSLWNSPGPLSQEAIRFLEEVQIATGTPILAATTGPLPRHILTKENWR